MITRWSPPDPFLFCTGTGGGKAQIVHGLYPNIRNSDPVITGLRRTRLEARIQEKHNLKLAEEGAGLG